MGRRLVPARLRRRRRARRLARERRGTDLRREPGLVRARRRRPRQRARPARARERPRAALHRPRRSSSTSPPTRRYRAELGEITSYPPGLQGERRRLLPQQHVDPPGLVPPRRRRPRARVLPLDLPVDAQERIPTRTARALRLRADDRRPGCRDPRRGEELVADRHGGLDVRDAGAGHPRDQARLRRAAHRPVHPAGLGLVPRHPPLPRRRLRDLGLEPGRRLDRQSAHSSSTAGALEGDVVPLAEGTERVAVEVVLGGNG